jgi:hypothetical protein
MVILFVLAAVILVLGILFLGGQENLKKLDAVLNKTVVRLGETGMKKEKEKLVGVLLIIFALILCYIGYRIKG